MKHKPNKERNAGQQAAIRAIRRAITKRQRQYESDDLQSEAYALIEVKGFISDYVRACSKRAGGSGRK